MKDIEVKFDKLERVTELRQQVKEAEEIIGEYYTEIKRLDNKYGSFLSIIVIITLLGLLAIILIVLGNIFIQNIIITALALSVMFLIGLVLITIASTGTIALWELIPIKYKKPKRYRKLRKLIDNSFMESEQLRVYELVQRIVENNQDSNILKIKLLILLNGEGFDIEYQTLDNDTFNLKIDIDNWEILIN